MPLSKSESARINGAKSRGPKTPAGKAISSQNATKHGLFAYALVIRGESPDAFQVFAESYVRRFEPRDDIELDIVRQMTAAMWRIARCWTLQTQTINEEMDLDGYGGDTVAARTFETLSKKSLSLQLLHRFENSYERVYNQALRTLANLRKNFPLPDTDPQKQQNEPKPPSGKPMVKSGNRSNHVETSPKVRERCRTGNPRDYRADSSDHARVDFPHPRPGNSERILPLLEAPAGLGKTESNRCSPRRATPRKRLTTSPIEYFSAGIEQNCSLLNLPRQVQWW